MIFKNYLFIVSFLIMFSFFEKVDSKYEKLFFDLNIKNINGENIDFNLYQDKVVLLVNVASNCGFTKQYSDLQKLWQLYGDKGLIVLGVPSNQFGGQEPGTNQEIKNFCEVNFNVNFIMTDKVDVKGKFAHPIFLWAKKSIFRASGFTISQNF